ncbi:MAG: uL15 family ribosomal protein [Candidatus Altiarchaeota archaeon]
MAQRNRKTQKRRGSVTHGYGNRQKHRGAGSRGGVGMAGSKKHKWNRISKEMPGYFGRTGFTRHKSISKDANTINICFIQDHLGQFIEKGVASKKGDTYMVDLTKTKYDKLLGTGKVSAKLKVTVKSCSAKARDKITAAGGSVESLVPSTAGEPASEAVEGEDSEELED